MGNLIAQEFLRELETEISASRKCIEIIPENLYSWKPHEKSMQMGYLVLLVADIPKWITFTIEKSVIDFVTWERFQAKNTSELVNYFDENIKGAQNALKNISDKELDDPFYLKNNGQILSTSSKKESVSQSINHLVHHRGQLTVYMRLNNILVPSIYGPSADDKSF